MFDTVAWWYRTVPCSASPPPCASVLGPLVPPSPVSLTRSMALPLPCLPEKLPGYLQGQGWLVGFGLFLFFLTSGKLIWGILSLHVACVHSLLGKCRCWAGGRRSGALGGEGDRGRDGFVLSYIVPLPLSPSSPEPPLPSTSGDKDLHSLHSPPCWLTAPSLPPRQGSGVVPGTGLREGGSCCPTGDLEQPRYPPRPIVARLVHVPVPGGLRSGRAQGRGRSSWGPHRPPRSPSPLPLGPPPWDSTACT